MRIASVALLLVLVGGCAAGPVLAPQATLPPAALNAPANYIVVTIRNPIAPAQTGAASTPRGYDSARSYIAGSLARGASHDLAVRYGLVEVSSWPIALLGVHCLVYALPANADRAELTAALRHDQRVETVQPLQLFNLQSDTYNDPYARLQKNIADLGISDAHAVTRGHGVLLAVIDTGADTTHPDLRLGATRSRNFVDNDSAAFKADLHGTAVAGIIGAVPNNGIGIVGIAPDVDLLIYKACWRAPAAGTASSCNTFTLAQAIAAAVDAHADIINLSLGGPSDPLLSRLIHQALDAGAIVVGAMPRDGTRSGFPVDIAGVIAVDMLETGQPQPGVLRVPGRDVLSLAPDGHYDFYTGSSLAAAEVSGIIALLKAERPGLTGHQVQMALEASTENPALPPNACAALASLRHQRLCVLALSNRAAKSAPDAI